MAKIKSYCINRSTIKVILGSFVNKNNTILRWTSGVVSRQVKHIVNGHQWCPTILRDSHGVNFHRPEHENGDSHVCGVLTMRTVK